MDCFRRFPLISRLNPIISILIPIPIVAVIPILILNRIAILTLIVNPIIIIVNLIGILSSLKIALHLLVDNIIITLRNNFLPLNP